MLDIKDINRQIAELNQRKKAITRMAPLIQVIKRHHYTKTELISVANEMDGPPVAHAPLAPIFDRPSTRTQNRKPQPVRSNGKAKPHIYFHPDHPEIGWSGHARRPHWIVTYIAKGGRLDDLKGIPRPADESKVLRQAPVPRGPKRRTKKVA